MEGDLNDWRWDGDLFVAAPLKCVPSDCRSRQLFPIGSDIPSKNGTSNDLLLGSDEAVLGHEGENRDMDKRRRVSEEAESLNLKIGGELFPLSKSKADKWEENSGKKTKVSGAPSSPAVCQVEDCKADLSNAKDYHRRHKVCEVHSKATSALVLSILFDGTVDAGENTSILVALLDIGVLHQAVRKKSRSMVEFLLKYHPGGGAGLEEEQLNEGHYLFRPDALGPGGLTPPLHVAASVDSCENVLDALTEDPGSVGIEAWKNARDSTVLTPYDYACLRGNYSYIHLVQRKLNRKSGNEQVVVNISGALLGSEMKQKIANTSKTAKWATFQTEKTVGRPCEMHCRECEQQWGCGSSSRVSLAIYRPAMLSMLCNSCGLRVCCFALQKLT